MLSLIQARLTGDCAPFLRNFTGLYNRMAGGERSAPPMSRPLDIMFVLAGVKGALSGEGESLPIVGV